MSIFEYDQEKHMRQEREAAWNAGKTAGLEEGRQSGLEEGRAQAEERLLEMLIQRKLAKAKNISEIAAELEETEERIQDLIREMQN